MCSALGDARGVSVASILWCVVKPQLRLQVKLACELAGE